MRETELVQGAKADHYADMWAVGVILYQMLSGKPVYKGVQAEWTDWVGCQNKLQ